MSAGQSTINTVLKSGATASALEKICRIKSYPQLGGEREQIETTDMEDDSQTFVPGVQSVDNMQFTANYDKNVFASIKETALTDRFYQLEFGKDGVNGVHSWKGQHDIYVNEGEVNGVRNMTLVIYPSTAVEAKKASELETQAQAQASKAAIVSK